MSRVEMIVFRIYGVKLILPVSFHIRLMWVQEKPPYTVVPAPPDGAAAGLPGSSTSLPPTPGFHGKGTPLRGPGRRGPKSETPSVLASVPRRDGPARRGARCPPSAGGPHPGQDAGAPRPSRSAQRQHVEEAEYVSDAVRVCPPLRGPEKG